jgi:hypothetical protein
VPTDVLSSLDSRARSQLLLFANESCDVRKTCESVCKRVDVARYCVLTCCRLSAGEWADFAAAKLVRP